MQSLPDYQKAFENSIVELCHSVGKDEVKKLDAILIQEKSEIEILKDIVTTFPKFLNIFRENLNN